MFVDVYVVRLSCCVCFWLRLQTALMCMCACIDVCVSTWSLVLAYTLYVWIVVWLRRGFNIGSQIENMFFFWLAAQCGRFQLRSNSFKNSDQFYSKRNIFLQQVVFMFPLVLLSLSVSHSAHVISSGARSQKVSSCCIPQSLSLCSVSLGVEMSTGLKHSTLYVGSPP